MATKVTAGPSLKSVSPLIVPLSSLNTMHEYHHCTHVHKVDSDLACVNEIMSYRLHQISQLEDSWWALGL